LPFSKWLPRHGIKMGGKNSTMSDIIKIDMWVDNDVPTLNNFYRLPFSKWPPQYAKIKHCPISSKFDMWVDNDVPN
jgi:hypothetical protein